MKKTKRRTFTFDLNDSWDKNVEGVGWDGRSTISLEFGSEDTGNRKTLRIICPLGASTGMLIDALVDVVKKQKAKIDGYGITP